MYEYGLLYTLSQLGNAMHSFFIWVFNFFQEPIPLLNNTPLITIGFSSVMSIFFLKPILDMFLGGILPDE